LAEVSAPGGEVVLGVGRAEAFAPDDVVGGIDGAIVINRG
jgi:hypothetical protein